MMKLTVARPKSPRRIQTGFSAFSASVTTVGIPKFSRSGTAKQVPSRVFRSNACGKHPIARALLVPVCAHERHLIKCLLTRQSVKTCWHHFRCVVALERKNDSCAAGGAGDCRTNWSVIGAFGQAPRERRPYIESHAHRRANRTTRRLTRGKTWDGLNAKESALLMRNSARAPHRRSCSVTA